jgi:hypothetical protein
VISVKYSIGALPINGVSQFIMSMDLNLGAITVSIMRDIIYEERRKPDK